MNKQTIVIAWRTIERVFDGKPFAQDLGGFPGMKEVAVGHAAVWVSKGTESDIAKAQAYCDAENAKPDTAPRKVLVYPASEKDPLGRAKRDIITGERPGPVLLAQRFPMRRTRGK